MSDGEQRFNSSESDPRYVRSWKCQVSVGELYRWILAKLSDKDIKRALHKYRDLMPRQSDWNRKLTQATSVPELGFRYLYRCGQIDESNHRTMQKMLKYIDRQDLLPYFDTILYNTNHANCSLEELQKGTILPGLIVYIYLVVLLDKVDLFLELSTMLTDAEVHADAPYEIRQCQPVDQSRITRASLKRRAKSGDTPSSHRLAVAKRIRFISDSTPTASHSQSDAGSPNEQSAAHACQRVRSGVIANSLTGPVVHTVLSTSLINIFAALYTTMPHVLEGRHQLASSAAGDLIHSLSSVSSLLAGMPHLLGLQPGSNLLLSASPSLRMNQARQPQFFNMYERQPMRLPNHPPGEVAPRHPPPPPQQPDQNAQAPQVENPPLGVAPPPPAHNDHPLGRIIPPLGLLLANRQGALPAHGAFPQPPPAHAQLNNQAPRPQPAPIGLANPPTNGLPPPVQLKQIVLSAGGIGITESPNDSLIQYYCSLKMRVTVDMGPSTSLLRTIRANEQEIFDQQIDRFIQASAVLRSRSSGEFICHLRFNRLYQLETFWRDYQSGLLRKVLMDMVLCPTSRSFFGRSPVPPVQRNSVGVQQQQAAAQPQQPAGPANPAPAAGSNEILQFPFLRSERWVGSVGYRRQSEVTLPPGFELPSLASLAEALSQLRQEHCRPNSSPFELNLFISRRDYENGRSLLMRNLRTIPSLNCLMSVSDFLSAVPQTSSSGCSAGDHVEPQKATSS